jgi:hypothetical protein
LNAKEEFLEDLISRRKKTTFKGYRRGLELFEEFYQKDFDTILKEAREKQQSEDVTEQSFFDRKIEAFYKWMLEKGYALTSARSNTLGIIQFFNFYRIPINAKVPMPPPSARVNSSSWSWFWAWRTCGLGELNFGQDSRTLTILFLFIFIFLFYFLFDFLSGSIFFLRRASSL